MMGGVNNIIFDFGGIIVDLDLQRAIRAFEDLGFNAKEYIGSYVQSGVFSQLERGEISVSEFYASLRTETLVDCTDEDIRKAWNSMLVAIPPQRLRFIRSLAERFDVYMLSNTNELHWDFACNELLASSDIKMYEPFRYIYLSHELHLAKPDVKIFQTVLDDAGLKAEETLFIDDSKDNCDAAAILGINTYHSRNVEDWMRILNTE